MKQVVHVVRKQDLAKKQAYVLQLELDYELASLYDAMQREDEADKVKSIERLKQIQQELEDLHVGAK